MRIIRFNESINDTEVYFRNKIDWKFYNYLEYKLTTIQDSGYESKILVMVSDFIYVDYIYTSDNNYADYINSSLEDVINMYNNNGLYYAVSIKSKNTDVIESDKINEYFDTIKNKASRIYLDRYNFLIVKPI